MAPIRRWWRKALLVTTIDDGATFGIFSKHRNSTWIYSWSFNLLGSSSPRNWRPRILTIPRWYTFVKPSRYRCVRIMTIHVCSTIYCVIHADKSLTYICSYLFLNNGHSGNWTDRARGCRRFECYNLGWKRRSRMSRCWYIPNL